MQNKRGRRRMNIGYGGKARRKETTRKTKRRLVDNSKMDLREIKMERYGLD
jgi:hypothetical protein